MQNDPNRFTFTDDDLERAARALEPDLDDLPEPLREEGWAKARMDAETVLNAVGGSYVG